MLDASPKRIKNRKRIEESNDSVIYYRFITSIVSPMKRASKIMKKTWRRSP
jgi:hypothetical protein